MTANWGFSTPRAGDVKGHAIRSRIRQLLSHGPMTMDALVRRIGWWTRESIVEEVNGMLITRELRGESLGGGAVAYRLDNVRRLV